MKVRIEIFEDDGTEKATFQFNDINWKERVTNFINLIDDTKPPSTASSSEMPIQQQSVQQSAQQPVLESIEQPISESVSQLKLQSTKKQVLESIEQPISESIPQPNSQSVQQPVLESAQQSISESVSRPTQQFVQQPIPQVQQPTLQPPMPQQIQPQQVPVNPQLQYSPYPAMQQPVYYYPQPVQYQLPTQTQQIYAQPLQQAAFPNNQSLQPQQHAAQQAVPLQTQVRQPHQPQVPLQDKINNAALTISERLELFLKYEYPHVWFTSQEIQGHYDRVYGFIKLSTVSTYLSRMYRKNLLQRRGNRTQREYMYICDEPEMVHADGMAIHGATGIVQ